MTALKTVPITSKPTSGRQLHVFTIHDFDVNDYFFIKSIPALVHTKIDQRICSSLLAIILQLHYNRKIHHIVFHYSLAVIGSK